MNDIAQNPYRILLRVPVKTKALSAAEAARHLDSLADGLRSFGFSSFLVAPGETGWELVSGKERESFAPRVEAWNQLAPAGVRKMREALGEELSRPAVAGIARLLVVIPFSAEGAERAGDWNGFAAVVDLGGKVAAGRDRFFFAYPREAAAFLAYVGGGVSGRPAFAKGGEPAYRHLPEELDRNLGSVRGEEPLEHGEPRDSPIARGDDPPVAGSEVYLGVGLPDRAAPGEYFVARFAAYAAAFRKEIRRILKNEAPGDRPRLDLERCRWKIGTPVDVRLAAEGAKVEPAACQFAWDGEREVLRFDVAVDAGLAARRLVLRFDLFVAGVLIAALRPEIALTAAARPAGIRELEVAAPRSAFASYASEDEKEVLGRVRSVEICTGMQVFVDRMSLVPGQRWHRVLEKEILKRDVFWLFWSRHAMQSEYVRWEWQTALRRKTLDAILPHPLEPASLAPPPPELAALQFGGAWEGYLASLGKAG